MPKGLRAWIPSANPSVYAGLDVCLRVKLEADLIISWQIPFQADLVTLMISVYERTAGHPARPH